MADQLTNVTVCDGKYTFVLIEDTDHVVEIKRHGEEWSKRINVGDLMYSRAIGALAAELHDARQEIAELKAAR